MFDKFHIIWKSKPERNIVCVHITIINKNVKILQGEFKCRKCGLWSSGLWLCVVFYIAVSSSETLATTCNTTRHHNPQLQSTYILTVVETSRLLQLSWFCPELVFCTPRHNTSFTSRTVVWSCISSPLYGCLHVACTHKIKLDWNKLNGKQNNGSLSYMMFSLQNIVFFKQLKFTSRPRIQFIGGSSCHDYQHSFTTSNIGVSITIGTGDLFILNHRASGQLSCETWLGTNKLYTLCNKNQALEIF
jgi:hypothetical protein